MPWNKIPTYSPSRYLSGLGLTAGLSSAATWLGHQVTQSQVQFLLKGASLPQAAGFGLVTQGVRFALMTKVANRFIQQESRWQNSLAEGLSSLTGSAVAQGLSHGAAALGFVAAPISLPSFLTLTVISVAISILLSKDQYKINNGSRTWEYTGTLNNDGSLNKGTRYFTDKHSEYLSGSYEKGVFEGKTLHHGHLKYLIKKGDDHEGKPLIETVDLEKIVTKEADDSEKVSYTGTITKTDGTTERGTFSGEGFFDGKGTRKSLDNKRASRGYFKENTLVEGERIDGDWKMIGKFKNRLLDGEGELINLKTKESFKGNFVNGKKEGYFIHTQNNISISEVYQDDVLVP